jgi:hypothetical protein
VPLAEPAPEIRENVAVVDRVELAAARGGGAVGVVDDQVVELEAVLLVGKIGLAEDEGIGRGARTDEQRALLVEVEARRRAEHGAARALDLQDGPRVDRPAVDRGPVRDQPEAGPGVAGEIDRDQARNLVDPGREPHRLLLRDRLADRGGDRGGVVVAVVADRPVTLGVDPRARADQHRRVEAGLGESRGGRSAGERERRRKTEPAHVRG